MRFGRYIIAALAADRGKKHPAQIFVNPTKPRRKANGAGRSQTPTSFQRLLLGCLLWYGLEPVADAPDTVDVGVVRRCLYAGPDAADVYVHRAAGGAPPGRH